MKVKSEREVAELYLTLGDPMDCSLPGSSVHGIFQARVLEWVPLPSPPHQKKLLELINKYSKVAGYKINTQNSFAFLYTDNEKTERESKETTPFTIATKRIKCLGISVPKETKDMYIENHNKDLYIENTDERNQREYK